jgi:leader peptidase (prepilin peptidase)/N-methyltransferase
VFVLGLVVGSFLNVVIYRLPIMLEREWRAQARIAAVRAAHARGSPGALHPERPRSACPIARRRSRPGRTSPSSAGWCCAAAAPPARPDLARYPAGGTRHGCCRPWVAWHFGFGAKRGLRAAGHLGLIALTGIDIDHQLLPDKHHPAADVGRLAGGRGHRPGPGQALPVSPRDAIIGAAAGYLSLWLVFHAFRLVTGKEGMGYGDFKLFAALGAWLGWKMLPLVIYCPRHRRGAGDLMIVLRGRDRAPPCPLGPTWRRGLARHDVRRFAGHGYLRMSGLKH